ncbi:cytochrome P450 [Cunninghamella echinulata]|nr:cytochrome P450 [Cunninghamella echinulata]
MGSLFQKYQENFNSLLAVNNSSISSTVNGLKNHKTPIIIAISLFLLNSIYQKYFTPPKHLKHIPHVGFFKFIKKIFQGAPHSTISKELAAPLYKQKKSGEMYLMMDSMGWTVNIVNPEDAKQVFLKSDLFSKAEAPFTKDTLTHNYIRNDNLALVSDKNEWKKHRMTVNPAFHRHMPVKLFTEYVHRVFDVIDSSNESTVDVNMLMQKFTLDIIGKAGFGFDFNSLNEKNNEWVETYHTIKDATENPIFFFFPFLETKLLWLFPRRRYEHAMVKKFYGMLEDVIENKRQYLKTQKEVSSINDAEKDLLTLMLESESSNQNSLTNTELKSNLNLFFSAGHDTTSNSLSAAMYYLAKHQDIQQRAREEAISILGDEPVNVFPTFEQTKELVFINQVIKETLRLSGPATKISTRITKEDTVLSGTFIPKNTPIVVNMLGLHSNENVWKDPYIFNPERFSPNGEAEQKIREGLSWAPFASGPRQCIGMNFSLAEQRVMLLSILRKYEFHLPENTIHKDGLITNNIGVLRPIDLKIIFKPRY